jgi:hypothetical protein
MQATVELPKAFSVRDDSELPLIQDLMARLNPKLLYWWFKWRRACTSKAATPSIGVWFTWMVSH